MPIKGQRFFGVDNVLDQFKFSPLKRDLSKSRCRVRIKYTQRFFWRLEIPMSLRAPSGEHEAKNRCQVGLNYKQRFFAVHGYLVS
jgi:hypothetical protein